MEKDIKIATSWSDVTLEQYDRLSEIKIESEEDIIKVLGVLTDLSYNELENLDLNTLNLLCSKIKFLNEEAKPCIPTDKLEIAGRKFNVTLAAQNMKAGQFLSYKQLINVDIDKKIARLMACFMIPEGHAFNDGYDTEELITFIYKNMTMVEALSYSNFFIVVFRAYADSMIRYLQKSLKKEKNQELKEQMTIQLEAIKALIALTGHSE